MKQTDTANIAFANGLPTVATPVAFPACVAICTPFTSIPFAGIQAMAFMQAMRQRRELERHERWVRRLTPSLN